MNKSWPSIALGMALVAAATAGVLAQTGAKNGEWPTYGGDLGNTRYSPLDQINASNFSKLEVAWRFKTEPRPAAGIQVRIDAADGQRRRLLDGRHAARGRRARCGHRRADLDAQRAGRRARRGGAAPASGRGLAYWTDGTRRADPLRHAGLSADRARREDRRARPELRQGRRRRSEAGRRSGRSICVTRRSRAALDAGGRRRTW